MTFTLLTVVIFLILGLTVTKMAWRGHSRGFVRSGMEFIAIIFSLLTASLLSSLVFAEAIGDNVIVEFGLNEMIAELSESVGVNFYTLFTALITMVVSSVIFLIVFAVILIIFGIILALVERSVFGGGTEATEYSGENEPWFRRNSNKFGALIGGISGFLIVLICAAPIVGTLKTGDKVLGILEDLAVIKEGDSKELDSVADYTDDLGVSVLYYCGGKIVYDLGARANVNGNTVILSREIDTLAGLTDEIRVFAESFVDMENIKSQDMAIVSALCTEISDSYFLSTLTADFVSSAARSWKNGETFMDMEFPVSDETFAPMFDSILSVFASTTYETVAEDVSTFTDICILLIDTGLLEAGGDYDSIMGILEDGQVINDLTAILEANPRMAFVTDSLYRTAMKTLVKTIKFDGYNVTEYQELIEDITGQLNRLQGQKFEKKVDTLTDYAVQYIGEYGVDVPESVAEMIVSSMISEIPADENGYIDPSQVSEFFDKYYTPAN